MVIEVGSQLDVTFGAVLKDTKTWLARNEDVGFDSGLLEEFLYPFPTFKSRHLTTAINGLVSNRDLIILRDPHSATVSGIGEEKALSNFNEQLLVARWMCEKPGERLYTRCFVQTVVKSMQHSNLDDNDDTVSAKTDSCSQVGT
jgi:hypothetical protein